MVDAGSEGGNGPSRDAVTRSLPPPVMPMPVMTPPTGQSPGATEFDVFLSHNSSEKQVVEQLAEQLRLRGFRPWFDTWQLVPGASWQDGLRSGLAASRSCAVLLGAKDFGAWQRPEIEVALDRAAHDPSFRVFLALLPGVPDPFDPSVISPFLSMRMWVDLRQGSGDGANVTRFCRAVEGVPIEGALRLPDAAECPYRGLLPFSERDEKYFFGRESDVQRLVEKLKSTQFLAVVGPSGSGKTSLVAAGLLPALRRNALSGSSEWRMVSIKPGARPLESLAAALLSLSPELSGPSILAELRSDENALSLRTRSLGGRMLLVIDQTEEAFTLCEDPLERDQFLANILRASGVGGPCSVVLTMRADFYAQSSTNAAFAQAVGSHQYFLGALGRTEFRQTIEQPALLSDLRLQPGLVDTILDDIRGEPGALPLMEHALLELWERRQDQTLTLAAYVETGGVAGAVATRAELIYADLDDRHREVTRQLMMRLTHPGEGSQATRRPATIDDVPVGDASPITLREVVDRFAEARLLTVSGDDRPVVEVSHEALIRAWPRLQVWLETDRDDIRVRERISTAAQEWEPKSDDGLWRGARLATALEWAKGHGDDVNDLERKFLDASGRVERAQARRRHRRVGAVIASLTVLAIVASALAISAARSSSRARNRERVATGIRLATQSENVRGENSALALALAAESLGVTDEPVAEAEAALIDARVTFGQRSFQQIGDPIVVPGVDLVLNVTFSPDGKQIVTSGDDGAVAFWDVADHREVGERLQVSEVNADRSLIPSSGPNGKVDGLGVADAVFSPDGTTLFALDTDGVHFYDAVTHVEQSPPLLGDGVDSTQLAFSADGQYFATGGWNGQIRIWDTASHKEVVAPLAGHASLITALAFSPDSSLLASASDDGVTRLWDLSTLQQRGDALAGSGSLATSLVFDAEGSVLFGATATGQVAAWAVSDGSLLGALSELGKLGGYEVLRTPVGNQLFASGSRGIDIYTGLSDIPETRIQSGRLADIETLAVSPDEKLLVGAGGNRVVVWELDPSKQVTRPAQANVAGGPADGVSLSTDGSEAAVSTGEGVEIWDTEAGTIVGRIADGNSALVTFSADGTRIMTLEFVTADEGTGVIEAVQQFSLRLRVWDGQTFAALGEGLELDGDDIAIAGTPALSPAGDLVAISRGRQIDQLDPVSLTPAGTSISDGDRTFSQVAYSSDGATLYAIEDNGHVTFWNASSGARLGEDLVSDSDTVTQMHLNTDGSKLLTVDEGNTIRYWDLKDHRLLRTVTSDSDVSAVVLLEAPDAAAYSTSDGRVKIIGLDSGDVLGEMQLDAFVEAVGLSGDGHTIATVRRDGAVNLWRDLLDPKTACTLSTQFTTTGQLEPFLADVDSTACQL
jgi:WD40 repeat protein/energy-coupling factor transporter ATP-binding protein EcfA2